jgi:divalent metal cation (Fe/Co/Zn/Cd) transporter
MHGYEHESKDTELLNTISGISIANIAIGAAELTAGTLTHSATLTMAGMHDISDGGLYFLKRKAAGESDPIKKRRLRRIGAGALMFVSLGLGAHEIHSHADGDSPKPDLAAGVVGVTAAAANIAAAVTMHNKRHNHNGKDTWRHIAYVDLPSAGVTLVATPLSVKYPGVDIAGSVAIMGLACSVGLSTWKDSATEIVQ